MADEELCGGFVACEDVGHESTGADLIDHSVDGGAAAKGESAELYYCDGFCAAGWAESKAPGISTGHDGEGGC
jgi:hypothetical protein